MIPDMEYLSAMRKAVTLDVKQTQEGRIPTQTSGGFLGHDSSMYEVVDNVSETPRGAPTEASQSICFTSESVCENVNACFRFCFPILKKLFSYSDKVFK